MFTYPSEKLRGLKVVFYIIMVKFEFSALFPQEERMGLICRIKRKDPLFTLVPSQNGGILMLERYGLILSITPGTGKEWTKKREDLSLQPF